MPGRRRSPEERGDIANFTSDALGAARPSATIRDQVQELGGTRAVAEQFGRSERTIRRWAQTDKVPARGGAASAFSQAVDAHRDTPQYRQTLIPHRRQTRMRNHGATLYFRGVAGPLTDSPGASIRPRKLSYPVDSASMRAIIDAYHSGGDAAAGAAINHYMADSYMGATDYGWVFQRIDEFQFLRHFD